MTDATRDTRIADLPLPTFEDLSPENAKSIAMGIVEIFGALQLEWVSGDYYRGWDGKSYTHACTIGALHLASGRDSSAGAFDVIFGHGGLSQDEMFVLSESIISGNDYGRAEPSHRATPEHRDQLIASGYSEESSDVIVRSYRIRAFGNDIGATVREHFLSQS